MKHKLIHTAMKMLLITVGVALGHFLFNAPMMLQIGLALITATAAFYLIEWNDDRTNA